VSSKAVDGSYDVTVSGVFHNGRNDPVSSVEVSFSYWNGGSRVPGSAFVVSDLIAVGGSEPWSFLDRAQPNPGSSPSVDSITYVDYSSGINCTGGD
jgi:hypothetical protein